MAKRWSGDGQGSEAHFNEVMTPLTRRSDAIRMASALLQAGMVRVALASQALFAALLTTAAASAGPSCTSAGVQCLVGHGLMHESALDLTEVLWVGNLGCTVVTAGMEVD